jgi:hypothetical protein
LDQNWRNIYKVNIPRGLFSRGEMRDACGQDRACMAKEKRGRAAGLNLRPKR